MLAVMRVEATMGLTIEDKQWIRERLAETIRAFGHIALENDSCRQRATEQTTETCAFKIAHKIDGKTQDVNSEESIPRAEKTLRQIVEEARADPEMSYRLQECKTEREIMAVIFGCF